MVAAVPRIRSFDEGEFGVSWVIDEALTRTSHALVDDGRVWLVDPVDVPEAMERVAGLGTPAAVLQLLDRHNRDGAAIAGRLGVPHVRIPDAVPDSPFEVVEVVSFPGWKEKALWWPALRALVVAEAVGTNKLYTAGTGAAGVHIALRLFPPGVLRRYDPAHLLVGHGRGLHGPQAATGLVHALDRSRRDLPLALVRAPGAFRRG